MNVAHAAALRNLRCLLVLLIPCAVLAGLDAVTSPPPAAQAAEDPPERSTPARDDAGVAEGERAAEEALRREEPDTNQEAAGAAGSGDAGAAGSGDAGADQAGEAGIAGEGERIRILKLLFAGGYLMLPIAAMSILVVTFLVERLLGLRRRKVLPPKLVSGLGKLAEQKGGLDPRRAYKLCQHYPSAAANVIKTMLLKVGRPQTELEHAVSEANNREAARLYSNVRWLSLATSITPLMGLLGTVWGMIKAFFVTANLPIGANKAQHLADGIYVALVTTLAGLLVAIPAAIAAHLFEGRIQRLFRELDETLLGLMPQLERFEGRLRVSKDTIEAALPSVGHENALPNGQDGTSAARAAQQQPAPAPK